MKNFVGKLFCSKGCRVVDFDCIIAFHIVDDVCRSVIGLVLEFLSDFRCDKHSIGLFVPWMIDTEASVLGIEGSDAKGRRSLDRGCIQAPGTIGDLADDGVDPFVRLVGVEFECILDSKLATC